MLDLNLEHMPAPPSKRDWRIGVIGAGFVVRDVQLVAYAKAGFNVQAIASADPEMTRATAAVRGIPKAYETVAELLGDESLEVLDVAVPPHAQLEVMRQVARARHIRAVLAQKPLGMNLDQAKEVVELCQGAGIKLGVNQNMRYDQAMRALKTVLARGYLGEPVLGTIEMRSSPHWKPWTRQYDRLTLMVMSIHHLDAFRFLFGDPEWVYCSARTDPRTPFPHRDGIVMYVLEYANGFRAAAWDDVWGGPAKEGAAGDTYIKWRVEGTEGLAQGTIGWPAYPNAVPSTLELSTKAQPGCWLSPRWKEVWFPDAFSGTMGMLLHALNDGTEPAISGRDNLKTIALLDACYRSIDEHRPVRLGEVLEAAGLREALT